MPRQVSCTINQTLANWGRAGHNVSQTHINTTVSTTKGWAGEGMKANKHSLFVRSNLLRKRGNIVKEIVMAKSLFLCYNTGQSKV